MEESMANHLEDDELIDIDDPVVPEEIRAHGARFKNPARYVADLGNDEYVLYAQDGELLDMVYLK